MKGWKEMQQLRQGHLKSIFMRLTLGQESTQCQTLGTAESGCTLLIIILSMAMLPIQIKFETKNPKPTGVNKLKRELLK